MTSTVVIVGTKNDLRKEREISTKVFFFGEGLHLHPTPPPPRDSACINRYISAAATPAGSQLSVSISTRTDSVQQSQSDAAARGDEGAHGACSSSSQLTGSHHVNFTRIVYELFFSGSTANFLNALTFLLLRVVG